MIALKRTLSAVLAAAFLALGACSAFPGSNNDEPAGVVNAAMAAAESSGIAKLSDYACAASKDDIASALGAGGNVGDLSAAGIDIKELSDAMRFDFQDTTVTETSRTDTDATVHVKGKIALTFDAEKMKAVIKKVLAAQGIPADDNTVNIALSALTGQLSQTRDLDNDVKLTRENGKWLVCN